jgi:hypothetical protein
VRSKKKSEQPVPEPEVKDEPKKAIGKSRLGGVLGSTERTVLGWMNLPSLAEVSIDDKQVFLDVSDYETRKLVNVKFSLEKAGELGRLLVGAAERHAELLEQLLLNAEQESSLKDAQQAHIQELMK